SKDKTPVLYEQSNGDKNNITIDALSNAVIRGEEPVINIVNRFIANFAILLNNLACMHFTQRIILHNVELSERQLDYLKRGIAKHVGEDIAERLVLSGIDKKNLFSAGCALIIQESFYFKGGMQ
ncbi:MAG: ROK family transcriptional regulator, partial [Ruminococcus sp.]